MPPEAESSEITTHPPRAAITSELVQPPSRVYLTLNDRLYIRSRNSLAAVTLRVAGRLLSADGEIVPFNFEHTPATDRTASLESFQLGEGFLLSAVVFPSVGAPTRGQTFVELGFLRGLDVATAVVDVLAKDYVAENEPVAFPGSPIRSSLEGPGNLRSITGTNPAAGVEIVETVPTDARWRLDTALFRFVSDATVADRRVGILIDDGATELMRFAANSEQAASASPRYVFANTGIEHANRSGAMRVAAPFPISLSAGFRVTSNTTNIQAGDDYGAPQLLVEEWLED